MNELTPEQKLEQAAQEIAQLKVRVFDAEEGAKNNGQILNALAQKVVEGLDLKVENLEGLFKALDEKFQPVAVETVGDEA